MPKQPQSRPAVEPQVDSDSGRVEWGQLEWGRISRGLQLKLIAAGILAGLFAGLAVLMVASPRTLALPTVLYLLAAVFLLTLLIDFAGRLLCLTPVSSPQSTRVFVAASIGSQLFAIILLFTPLLAVPELPLSVQITIGLLLAGCGQAIAAVLFMVYVRKLAIMLGRADLARWPLIVLSFNAGSLSITIILFASLCFILACPCMWWLAYVGMAILTEAWRDIGLAAPMLLLLGRLVPTLLFGLLLYSPLYRYGKLLSELKAAVDRHSEIGHGE
ncbi:hypothetical protein SH139x_004659 [Planctomycetaceae bacterium SH139]